MGMREAKRENVQVKMCIITMTNKPVRRFMTYHRQV